METTVLVIFYRFSHKLLKMYKETCTCSPTCFFFKPGCPLVENTFSGKGWVLSSDGMVIFPQSLR